MKIGFKTLLLVGVLTAATGFAGCNTVSEDSESSASLENGEVKRASLSLTIDEYPKIDGSNANLPLMAEFMSRVTGIPLEEAQTRVNSSTTFMAWIGMADEYSSDTDMLLVYEAPENDRETIKDAEPGWDVTPIGRDGLVFLTHKSNPVKNLESQQIKDVYTGKITNWKELGGDDLTIKAFQRNNYSGSQAMFMKLVMENETPMEPPTEWLMDGSGLMEIVSAYDNTGGALGYSVFYYASEMYANPDLKILSVNGIEPSNKTIESGEYPYCNDFYMVTDKGIAEDSPTYKLREWILSEEGRQVMVEAGYVAPKAFG